MAVALYDNTKDRKKLQFRVVNWVVLPNKIKNNIFRTFHQIFRFFTNVTYISISNWYKIECIQNLFMSLYRKNRYFID